MQKTLDVGKSLGIAHADRASSSPLCNAFASIASSGWFRGLVRRKELSRRFTGTLKMSTVSRVSRLSKVRVGIRVSIRISVSLVLVIRRG